MVVCNLLEIHSVKSSYIIKKSGSRIFEVNSNLSEPPDIFCCHSLRLVNYNISVLIVVIEPCNDIRLFKRNYTV